MPKQRKSAIVAVAAFCVGFTGCATTELASQLNPAYLGTQYAKILVEARFQDLSLRQLAEGEFCKEVALYSNCECVESATLIFPGQTDSPEELAAILAENDIGAVIIIGPTVSGVATAYVPETSHTQGSATISGNTISGSSTTRTYGGYNLSAPWASYEVTMWDEAKHDVVWYATAQTTGDIFADWEDLVRSVARKTVSGLLEPGLIAQKEVH